MQKWAHGCAYCSSVFLCAYCSPVPVFLCAHYSSVSTVPVFLCIIVICIMMTSVGSSYTSHKPKSESRFPHIKGVHSRYFELLWPCTESPLNCRRLENMMLLRWKNIKELKINHLRTRTVNDGKDWYGLQTTNLKNLAKHFKMSKSWRGSFDRDLFVCTQVFQNF